MIRPVFIALSIAALTTHVDGDVSSWTNTGWPLVQQYCLDCHSGDEPEADLDLSALAGLGRGEDDGNQRSDVISLQRILEMVRFGAMPPEDAETLSDEDRRSLISALDEVMYSVSCGEHPNPSQVTARRLNRAEYSNSIRDLFEIDLQPADDFPSDEVGAGFDNNGDILSMSTMLMEKYFAAAERIAQQVVIDPATLPRVDKRVAADSLMIKGEIALGRFGGRFLATEAYAWIDVTIPVRGEYSVFVRGGNANKDDKPTITALFDESGKLIGVDSLEYYGGSGGSRSLRSQIEFEPGPHKIFVVPIESKRDSMVDLRFGPSQVDLDESVVAAVREH